MLTDLRIRNFKSIRDASIAPGRVTVLIGENGSGKSNFLEALAMAGAGLGDRLGTEFLVSRGIRAAEPRYMRSAFSLENDEIIRLDLTHNTDSASLQFKYDNTSPYSRLLKIDETDPSDFDEKNLGYKLDSMQGGPSAMKLTLFHTDGSEASTESILGANPKIIIDKIRHWYYTRDRARQERLRAVADYVIYSPENTALRTFEVEGQIQPLGIKGEGLFKLLKSMRDDEARIAEIKEQLGVLDWFADFRLPTDAAPYERHLEIRDRFIADAQSDPLAYFDQVSANEGFLFLLFYFALFVSPDTPRLFAIDNIEASLNPKLCMELTRRLVVLAKKYDKQVIMTTHNPAVLDGLDLQDDEQRLYAISRTSKGHSRARRVHAPVPLAGEPPVALSEAFSRGLIGGLPQNF